MKLRPIAIHLPQFHPIPENDEWWGKGFTEWTNVTKAKPLFKGHYQPHLPADLGFYDLRLEEARMAQAELAKAYGIHGFCFYHYWFNGKRLLNRPLDDMIKTRTPDFPFMFCWANENWSRRWDGMDQEVLIQQDYNEKDDVKHIHFLADNFFSDNRYIKFNGKVVFAIYKPFLLPNLERTLATWRKEVRHMGLGEMLIMGMNSSTDFRAGLEYGLDYLIDFQPNFGLVNHHIFPPTIEKLKKKLGAKALPHYDHKIASYAQYVDEVISTNYYHNKLIPGITPGWDNSPRKKKNGFIFRDAHPDDYSRWLAHLKNSHCCDLPFVMINAWNEWAEGNHLEPCRKWGRSYLEHTKKILRPEI